MDRSAQMVMEQRANLYSTAHQYSSGKRF